MKLLQDFYMRKNVVSIAKDLLGKQLITNINGVLSGGLIVETEAYSWKEQGCHAYNARITERNKVMFKEGGHAYVYLCYGMHNLFNVVTNREGVAEAVLIRAIEPTIGIETMKGRRGSVRLNQLTSGPGKLTKALGINRELNGKFLLNDEVWLEDINYSPNRNVIQASPRIGIDYAGEDAMLPWRFYIKGNMWVSKIL